MNDAMREWSEAWQRTLLSRRSLAVKARRPDAPYEWAEKAVAVLFMAGWMAAIFSGRL